MNAKIISNGIVRAALILTGLYVLVNLLFQIKAIFIYTAFAFVLALIGGPMVRFFQQKLRLKKFFAVCLTMFLFISFCVGFVFMFIPLFTTQAQNLSVLNTSHLQQDFNGLIEQLDYYLDSKGFSLDKIIEGSNLKSQMNLDFIPNLLNSILSVLSDFGIGLFSILFITFFFLKDRVLIEYQFKKIFPPKHENKVMNSIDKINNLLSRYFVGLILQLSIVFVLTLIVLLIFGVKGAVMIAFICALLNIIPYIGPLIANILGVLLTMLSYISESFTDVVLPKAISVMIGFLIIQIIDNSINQPLIFSNSVRSHPLEIFIVILASGMFTGIFGMIAAVPIYTCLKVIGKEFFPNVRFIQILTKKL